MGKEIVILGFGVPTYLQINYVFLLFSSWKLVSFSSVRNEFFLGRLGHKSKSYGCVASHRKRECITFSEPEWFPTHTTLLLCMYIVLLYMLILHSHKKWYIVCIHNIWTVWVTESVLEHKHSRSDNFLLTVRFGQTVRPNFYCAVWPKWQNFFLQNTEHFFHITFNANDILSYFCFAKWPTCRWSSSKIAKGMQTESKLEWNYHINLKLFVSLLDLGFPPN